ncbi:hypothetical protein [Kingella oralis]
MLLLSNKVGNELPTLRARAGWLIILKYLPAWGAGACPCSW